MIPLFYKLRRGLAQGMDVFDPKTLETKTIAWRTPSGDIQTTLRMFSEVSCNG